MAIGRWNFRSTKKTHTQKFSYMRMFLELWFAEECNQQLRPNVAKLFTVIAIEDISNSV